MPRQIETTQTGSQARHSPVEWDIWEITSGHSAATVSDRYGSKKPDMLLAARMLRLRVFCARGLSRAQIVLILIAFPEALRGLKKWGHHGRSYGRMTGPAASGIDVAF